MTLFGEVVMAAAMVATLIFVVMYIGAMHISIRFNKDHNVKDLNEAA